MKPFCIFLVLTFVGPLWILFKGEIDFHADYRTADRQSAHLSPDPKTTEEAIIQAFAARAFNWRGIISTHTWIATKAKNSNHYTVYQIVGWRAYQQLPPLLIANDIPDRNWYNQKPILILDLRGKKAEKLIPKIDAVARDYPFANDYELWPGPNSNTFPAYIGRQIPELGLVLPPNAIGKDYLGRFVFFAKAPSGTGYQISIFGVAGILVAKREGLEINLLGLVFGVKLFPFSISLPGIGDIF